jgi:hypothetical protein
MPVGATAMMGRKTTMQSTARSYNQGYPIFTDTVDVREFRVQPFFGGTAAPWNLPAGYTYSENG